MNRLAHIISAVFHPAWMPAFGMFLILTFGLPIHFKPPLFWFIVISTFVTTGLVPVVFILFMVKQKQVSSIRLPNRKERVVPFLICVAGFYAEYLLLREVGFLKIVQILSLSAFTVMLSIFLINLFYKLSIHMAAVASITAAMVVLSQRNETNLQNILIALILLSGIIGFARLQLKAHSNGEVAVGYIVGFAVQYFALQLMFRS